MSPIVQTATSSTLATRHEMDSLQPNMHNQRSNVTFVPAINQNDQMGIHEELKAQFARHPALTHYNSNE